MAWRASKTVGIFDLAMVLAPFVSYSESGAMDLISRARSCSRRRQTVPRHLCLRLCAAVAQGGESDRVCPSGIFEQYARCSGDSDVRAA